MADPNDDPGSGSEPSSGYRTTSEMGTFRTASEGGTTLFGSAISDTSSVRQSRGPSPPPGLSPDEEDIPTGAEYVPVLRHDWRDRPHLATFEKVLTLRSKAHDVTMKLDTKGMNIYGLKPEAIKSVSYVEDDIQEVRPNVEIFGENAANVAEEEPEEEPDIECVEPFSDEMVEEIDATNVTELRKAFQKSLVEPKDDEMVCARIVGWTQGDGRLLLANCSDLGDLSEETATMTDTIFPVFVCGPNAMPVNKDVIDKDIFAYDAGLYLMLSDYPTHPSYPIQFKVYKQKSLMTFTAQTYKASLNYYIRYDECDRNEKVIRKHYRNFGPVNRILDKDNLSYYKFGIYAGGPLPHASTDHYNYHRITYDQPQDLGEDFGFSSLRGQFRHEVNYQNFSQRVGYLCSKDALLFVTETRGWVTDQGEGPEHRKAAFRSIFKDYCYAIVDGMNSYCLYYTIQSARKVIPFREEGRSELDPQIVITSEGLSALSISENQQNANFRNGEFFNENPGFPPMVLNWTEFQRSFESGSQAGSGITEIQPTSGGIQRFVNLNDINDHLICPMPSINRTFVFSLKQAPNYFPQQQRYDEYWHVFGLFRAVDSEEFYCYLGTISNSYQPYRGRLSYSRTFFQRSLFPQPIDTNTYPFITPEEGQTCNEMLNEWQNIMRNNEFKQFVRILIQIPTTELRNGGIFAQSRQNRLRSLGFQ